SISAIWSRWAAPRSCSPNRPRSRRKPTLPGGSDDGSGRTRPPGGGQYAAPRAPPDPDRHPGDRRPELCLLVRRDAGALRSHVHDPPRGLHGPHRAIGVRQEHVPALRQPAERAHPGHPPYGRYPARGGVRVLTRHGCGGAASRGRHGVPAAEPLPQEHLRQRGVRAAPQRPRPRGRHARARGARAAPGGAVGRGERPARGARDQPVGRPAAAPLHRARARERARSAPDGRALFGARSGRHPAHRGTAGGAEAELFDRHRDAQHAAGVPRVGFHGILLPRPPDRVRRYQATVHQAHGRAHRGLHHGTVRMSASPRAAHRHFHDELAELKAKLLTMSGEAQEALGHALDALLKRDAEYAARVIAGDGAIDALELEIEETVIDLLATQQPMARDLRLLVAATKIANDLERVGDHAVNIAQSAERRLGARMVAPEPELLEMARQARAMLSGALDAFVRGDAALGREICRRDDSVDAFFFQAEDGIRAYKVTGVQTCALPISMTELAAHALPAYRALVYDTPEFIAYFRAATPIAEIAELNIGSRPASRTASSEIEDLRA